MKRIFVFLMLIMFFVNARAGQINKLVFFGDSLSDNGNLYSLLFHIIPKSPPYFQGRFSNGATWAENLGKYYYTKNFADYKIYAYGGATAVFHMPSTRFLAPTLLELEVDRYLVDSIFSNKSQALYSIWIGANDYLFDYNVDPDALTTKVVNKISWAIETLGYYGGKNFLIINLPDLSRIPKIRGSGAEDLLHTFTLLHNQKLDAAIQKIKINHPDITITMISAYDLFTDVMDNPEKYNKKYNLNVTNLSESCWKGGFVFKKTLLATEITKEIQRYNAANNTESSIDPQLVSDFITQTPELAEAFQLSQSYKMGNVPCANPDQYLFWDALHPTAIVHAILSQIAIEQLAKQIG